MIRFAKPAEYGSRGGNARAHQWVIDGGYYTTAQVAKRLGVSLTTAQRRLRTRGHTWEALK